MQIERTEAGTEVQLNSVGDLSTLRFAAVIYRSELGRFGHAKRIMRRDLLSLAGKAGEGGALISQHPESSPQTFDPTEVQLGIAALRWSVEHPKNFVSPVMREHFSEMLDALEATPEESRS